MKSLYRRVSLWRLWKPWGLHYRGFTKPLYIMSFDMEALQNPRVEGVLLWRLCKVPSIEGLCYGAFLKSLYRKSFTISGNNMPPKAFPLVIEIIG